MRINKKITKGTYPKAIIGNNRALSSRPRPSFSYGIPGAGDAEKVIFSFGKPPL